MGPNPLTLITGASPSCWESCASAARTSFAFLVELQKHRGPKWSCMTPGIPGDSSCTFRWGSQLPQGPRELFPSPRSEQRSTAFRRLGPELTSLLCSPSSATSLPAGSCPEARPSTLKCTALGCSVPALCQERMFSCILHHAILQEPLTKKPRLTKPRLHTAGQSQRSYSAPDTQGLRRGTAQRLSCTRLHVRPQHLLAR